MTEMIERMKAERAERNKPIAGLIGEQGRPTSAGRKRMHCLFEILHEALEGHLDNTGTSCRLDLDGHDCCHVCNQAEDMLRVTVRYYEDE